MRFDASDLMDPRVGAGSFFRSALYYIGTLRLDEALEIAQFGYGARTVAP